MTTQEVYQTYVAAWDEPDLTNRDHLLIRSLAKDATVAYLTFEATNRAEVSTSEVSTYIGRLHKRFPGMQARQHSGIEEHHGWLRVAWRFLWADGSPMRDGVDVAEVASAGRLRRVVGFHDPLPAG